MTRESHRSYLSLFSHPQNRSKKGSLLCLPYQVMVKTSAASPAGPRGIGRTRVSTKSQRHLTSPRSLHVRLVRALATQSVGPSAAASASPGNFSETQTLGPPDLLNQNLHFRKIPRDVKFDYPGSISLSSGKSDLIFFGRIMPTLSLLQFCVTHWDLSSLQMARASRGHES